MNDIDSYISALSVRLLPLGKARNEILREARSHLEEAKDYHIQQGIDSVRAEALAVDDFGPVSDVARGYISTHPVAMSWITILAMLSVPLAVLTVPYGPLSTVSLLALPVLYAYLFLAGSYSPMKGSLAIGLVAGIARIAALWALVISTGVSPRSGEFAVFFVTTLLTAGASVMGSALVRRYDRD